MGTTEARGREVLKRTLTVAVIMFVASSVALGQRGSNAGHANTETEQAIIQTVHDAGQAFARHDLAALERLLADDYTHTDVMGEFLTRDEWLAQRRSDPIAHQLQFEDVKVRIYGDIAVVTGRNIWRPGTRFLPLPLRFTLVLTREKGYWQRLVFQAGFERLPRYFLLTIAATAVAPLLMTWVLVSLRSIVVHRWKRARAK